jgi:hypothetical protein
MVANVLPRANTRNDGFPEDEFVLMENIPVFAEHETTARNGRKLRFRREELEAIVERCNRRIRETGDYAAITIGHTPEPGEGHDQPPVVGFAGPFRLGLLGEPGQRQRYAILADMHVYIDKADVLKEHPRRSPELWLEDDYDQMYLDPISLISEPPRLDMGLLYSASHNGRLCEKYAAAGPSAMSVFIPSFNAGKKRYAADPPNTQGNAIMALSPDDVRSIVDALEQLDWVQFVKGMMEEKEGAGAAPEDQLGEPGVDNMPGADAEDALAGQDNAPAMPPAGEAAGMPPSGLPPASPVAEVPGPGGAPGGGDAGLTAGPLTEGPPPGENAEKEKLKEYAASGSIEGTEKAAGSPSLDGTDKPGGCGCIDKKYSAGCGAPVSKMSKASANGNVQEEIQRLRAELSREKYARVNAERRQHLEALRRDYVFDPDDEMEFAAAEAMSDDHFVKYSKSLAQKCVRVPFGDIPTQFLTRGAESESPRASASASNHSKEKYARDLSDRALKYCEAKAISGQHVVYEDVLGRLQRGEALPA